MYLTQSRDLDWKKADRKDRIKKNPKTKQPSHVIKQKDKEVSSLLLWATNTDNYIEVTYDYCL